MGFGAPLQMDVLPAVAARLAREMLLTPMATYLPAPERKLLEAGRLPLRPFGGWMDLRLAPGDDFVAWFADPASVPSPFFDPAFYLSENPDVRAARFPPLAHFWHHGLNEGRRPCAVFEAKAAQAMVESEDWVVYGQPVCPVGAAGTALGVETAWLAPMTREAHGELARSVLGAALVDGRAAGIWAGADGVVCGNWVNGDAVARFQEAQNARVAVERIAGEGLAGPLGVAPSPKTPRGWWDLSERLAGIEPDIADGDGPALVSVRAGNTDRETLWRARRCLGPLVYEDAGEGAYEQITGEFERIERVLSDDLAGAMRGRQGPDGDAVWIVLDCFNPRAMRSGHLEHAMLLTRAAQLCGRTARLVMTHETDRLQRHFEIESAAQAAQVFAATRRQMAEACFPPHLAALNELTAQVELVQLSGWEAGAEENLKALCAALDDAPPAAILVYGDIYRPSLWQAALHQVAPLVFLPAARENAAVGPYDLALTQNLPAGAREGRKMGYRPPVLYDIDRHEARLERSARAPVVALTAVGNGCLEEWLLKYPDALGEVLANEALHWRLIGLRDPEALKATSEQVARAVALGRLSLSRFDPQILSSVAASDLYLHPPGLRGGGSVVGYAAARGSVVVAGRNDAESLLPDPVIGTVAEWVERVDDMVSDGEARAKQAARQLAHLEAASQPEVLSAQIDGIISAARECRSLGRS